MTEATRPHGGRGSVLAALAFAAALLACLVLCSQAFAAADKVAPSSSSTKITLTKGFMKKLKKSGVKIQKVAPASLKGNLLTLPVSEGEIDPTNGQGTLSHEGGLKFKKGRKSAIVKNLVLETATSSIRANVAGKNMKLASVRGLSNVRTGFGVTISGKSLKLTGSAASRLNKKVAVPAKKKHKKKKNKKTKRATLSKKKNGKKKGKKKGSAKPFKGGLALGSSVSEAQPSKVTLLPAGTATLATDGTTMGKLENVKVGIAPTGGTTVSGTAPAVVYTFPIVGGLIAPNLTSGLVETNGGVKLTQVLQTGLLPSEKITTEITLDKMGVDLANHTLIAEVVAASDASPALNLGNLGRSSIADVNGGTVAVDPISRTVKVENAAATLQTISAEVLNGFVEVYAGYRFEFAQKAEGKSEQEAAEEAGKIKAENAIHDKDPLGTVSFSGTTQ
jgi:hypothetical protein